MCRGDICVFQMQFWLLKKFHKIWRFLLKFPIFYLKVSRFWKFLNLKILRAIFSAMLFYVCGPNLVFVSCKSTALQRFAWNNFFFYKNGRTCPQFDLYNFWPWVTLGKSFSEDAYNWCPERYWKFQSAIPNRIWVIDEKPPGGPLGTLSGRGLTTVWHHQHPACNNITSLVHN